MEGRVSMARWNCATRATVAKVPHNGASLIFVRRSKEHEIAVCVPVVIFLTASDELFLSPFTPDRGKLRCTPRKHISFDV